MMDFSTVAGASYTEEQKKQMAISLAICKLGRSARFIVTQQPEPDALLYQGSQGFEDAKQFAGSTVFGVRVRFPLEPFNSWARIQPPFDIPAFEPKADIDDAGVITPKADQQGSIL
jgi:hypothetical protein